MPNKTTAAGGGEGRLSALPDDVLLHVLSYLPSDDAVRTSVLTRRWLHLLRSTRAVRIVSHPRDRDWRTYVPVGVGPRWTPWTLNAFVNHLLLFRGSAPLDEFEVTCGEIHRGDMENIRDDDEWERARLARERDEELSRFAGAWIHHVLTFCHARVLRFAVRTCRRRLQISGRDVFVSNLLTRAGGPHRRHSQVRRPRFHPVPGVGGS
ncbi:unnamed protein product [Urochloa humidicola]